MADREERHEVEREKCHDEPEDAVRPHASDELPVGWQDQEEQDGLYADGVAAKFCRAFRQDQGLAHRPYQVVGEHQREGLERQDADAAAFAGLDPREEGQEPLESRQAHAFAHGMSPWIETSKKAPGQARPGAMRLASVRSSDRARRGARAATIALTGCDDAAGFWSSRRVSKELTSVDISRAVVATAARPETICLVREDIPLLMTILLKLWCRTRSDAGVMLNARLPAFCQ